MRSLRGRLTAWLLGGAGLLLTLGALTLARLTELNLQREFDAALEAQARSLATLTEQEHGRIWLEAADTLPELFANRDREYYQIWLADAHVIARSSSLGNGNLWRQGVAPLDRPRFADHPLPDGRAGRYFELRFVPRYEEDEQDERLGRPAPPPAGAVPPVTLVVARSRENLDHLTESLHLTLAAVSLSLLGGLAVLVRLSVAAGLAPVDRLADRLRGFDAGSLDQRLDAASTPAELAPVVEHLNGLLARLEDSFTRERTFSSNLAHELRTPLAELRTLSEVALRWPEDTAATAEALADIRAAGLQMESIVLNLLDLARCDGGLHAARPQRFAVADAVEDCWQKVEEEAAAKEISLVPEIAPGLAVTTDREKLDRILVNLFANAVAYSPAGSEVHCAATASPDGGFALAVRNPADGLTPGDLPHLFDRFWRKDTARANGHHAGLGLSLVAAFCRLLDLRIEPRLTPEGLFEIRLQAPDAAAVSGASPPGAPPPRSPGDSRRSC